MVRVSALITVYNDEKYVARAVESLLQQDLPETEIVVVDDGSVDSTPDILRAYERMPCVQIHRLAENQGRVRALNEGLGLCRGRFVAINDSDDYSLPGRIKTQWDAMETNSDLVLVASQASLIDEQGCTIGLQSPPMEDVNIRKALAIGNPFVHSTVMYRKEAVEAVGGFNENLVSAVDYDLIVRLMAVGNAMIVPEPLLCHRIHSGQKFTSGMKKIERWKRASDIALRAAWSLRPTAVPLALLQYLALRIPLVPNTLMRAAHLHRRIRGYRLDRGHEARPHVHS